MTAPTNWPDPKRPGVPLFPDRNGEHKVNFNADGMLVLWMADQKIWWVYDTDQYFCPAEAAKHFSHYHGPVLTPAQIAEMLAAERERCARAAQEISDDYYAKREASENDDESTYADERMCAASECSQAIRKLGDAS